MYNVKILDCTLRDGGYINQFNFGEYTIKGMVNKLTDALLDIVECGFIRRGEYSDDETLFSSISELSKFLPDRRKHTLYVAMIQYGAIDVMELEEASEKTIDGIRLTFHENEIDGAFHDARILMEKGYRVFIQPVGTTSYSDQELLCLIERVNELHPYAFYMVDTMGIMYKKDVLRMFYLIDNNLDEHIAMGFHSHNNLQMSFANALELIDLNVARQIILDSSIYGMGRGAGNLCTELIIRYINENVGYRYNSLEVLEIMDSYIAPLKKQYEWGYQSSYFLASINGCHPNYANYLLNLQTLRIQDINAILSGLDYSKRNLFDRTYIEQQYVAYLSHHIDDQKVLDFYRELTKNRKIMLVAPGSAASLNREKLNQMIQKEDVIVIGINFLPDFLERVDIVFFSNQKRFANAERSLADHKENTRVIGTSNLRVKSQEEIDRIDYATYLNEEQTIIDNAGLMCINFCRRIGASRLWLAGFDGFSEQIQENYYDTTMYMDVEKERLREMNAAFARKVKQIKLQMEIQFVTPSIYEEC